MKTVGIICEYNPLHDGHKYMFDKLRSSGADRIVCLMSGSVVQRGDFAILPKNYRAAAAIGAGADVVFELPYPWCGASAQYFATAGVKILGSLGVDSIAFGSESADNGALGSLAHAAIESDLKREIRTTHDDVGTAKAYFGAIGGGRMEPNDILGVEYLKAAQRLGYDMPFEIVRRIGAGYNDNTDNGEAFPSASALRVAMQEGRVPDRVPQEMAYQIRAAVDAGECPVLLDRLSSAILSYWRLTPTAESAQFAECGGGVAQRLHAAAMSEGDIYSFSNAAATKKYTNSRFRRAVLFAMTGVTVDDLNAAPAYINLLAAGEGGRTLITSLKRKSGIPIVSKAVKYPDSDPAACRQFELSSRADALYTLAMPRPRHAGRFLQVSPYFMGGED